MTEPKKQTGMRLPTALWDRTKLVAAAAGLRPGEYVALQLEKCVSRDEEKLLARLGKARS